MTRFRSAAFIFLFAVTSNLSAQASALKLRVGGQEVTARSGEAVIAFVDVSVVPMDKERVLTNQTVLVKGDRIVTIGSVREVKVPTGAMRIDGRGKYLIPGLADMHAHLGSGTHIATPLSPSGLSAISAPKGDSASMEQRAFLWLVNGVTTLRNLDYYDVEFARQALRIRAKSAAGKDWLPHIYTAGPWGPTHYLWAAYIRDAQPVLDSVSAYVTAYKAAGFDFIKIHEESPVILDSVLAAAKRIGLPVMGHVPPPNRAEHAAAGGFKSIEHTLTEYLWSKRTAPSSSDTAGIGPLLSIMRKENVWHCPTQLHYDRLHIHRTNVLKIEMDSGIKMLLGTDEVPWMGVITRELQAMVSGGLTPYQALLTGTRHVAEYFGTENETGTLTVGKRADMVLLRGNPLDDVRNTAQPSGVMVSGRWLDRDEIDKRVAGLQLPTFESSDNPNLQVTSGPVKTYWNNVADELNMQATQVYAGIALNDSAKAIAQSLVKVQVLAQRALVDSLGTNDQYTVSTQRIVGLIALQLGAYRKVLTADQQVRFDKGAKMWIKLRGKGGYVATIPGVE